MCPSMKQPSREQEYSVVEESLKNVQPVVIGEDSIQRFLDLEVVLVALSREHIKLVATSTDVIERLRKLRVQFQDMESL